jgi:hypothetical protein
MSQGGVCRNMRGKTSELDAQSQGKLIGSAVTTHKSKLINSTVRLCLSWREREQGEVFGKRKKKHDLMSYRQMSQRGDTPS